jgi:nicotinate phosphoribosyltransferase
MLDKAKLSYVEIFASGNLDEYKIASLIKDKAPIDNFGVGTNMGVSEDAPYLDIIYKITEVSDLNGRFLPTMKLSRGKVTYPGRKQIFRITDKKGMYLKDILGLEKEDIKGLPLLAKVVDKGKIIASQPSLEEIRKNTKDNLDCLPSRYKSLRTGGSYPIQISKGLEALTHRLSRVLEMRARQ